MKLITIGRDLDNDIIIHDTKVSRRHLQIIQTGADSFRIVDCHSTNGTFVNERKIAGEASLSPSDTVRIGNTILPWQTYFHADIETRYAPSPQSSSSHAGGWLAGVAVALVATVFCVFVFNPNILEVFNVEQQPKPVVVKMHEKNGVRYIPMKINGQELDFVFDTGASSICISNLEARILVKNGLLSNDDVIGEQKFKTASGEISTGTTISLKSVKIGDRELHFVEATVIDNPQADCLLGQTVLSRFGTYTIDNAKKEIIFE
ncbi:hypothetical protein AGMMS49982_11180 [Bacteroidia bacterium]|nr:hypothetical protein AGMMS49982_11180 [Bacteroidia bacterium]